MTTAEGVGPTEAERQLRMLAHLHDVLVVLLVFLRPLCWDGEPGVMSDLIWQGLAAVALLLVAVECAAGLRPAWLWSWRGIVGAALVAGLLPAVLGSPEPAPAWCSWSGWLACLAAAAYLTQVLPGRVRLAVAALFAAFGVVATLAAVQYFHVLPGMMADPGTAEQAAALGVSIEDLAERTQNGGAYATFQLGNQLGAWAAVLVALAAGCVWRARGGLRWVGVVVVLVGLGVMAVAGAKGAWLCLAAGAGVAWWVAVPGRWRWLPPALAALAVLAVALPQAKPNPVQRALHDSIAVRIGYWRSAAVLVAEKPFAGHGVSGFGFNQMRVMRAGDGPSRYVHDEPLEAAVSGGIWLGVLALLALLALAWPRREGPAAPEREIHPLVPWIIAPIVPYFVVLLGCMLSDNIGLWPGAGGMVGQLLWALPLGIGAAAICALLRRWPPPPGWACTAGLVAAAVSTLIDFNLHSAGFLGTALAVACLAPGCARSATGLAARWLPLVGAIAVAGCCLVGAQKGMRLADAESMLGQARQASTNPIAANQLRLALDPGGKDEDASFMAARKAWELAEGAPRTRLSALEMLTTQPEGAALAEELVREFPSSAKVRIYLARCLYHERRWAEAAAKASEAVEQAPTVPQVLLFAADVISHVAEHLPDPELPRRAATLRTRAAELQQVVYPTLRVAP